MMIARWLLQLHLNDQLFIRDNFQPTRKHLINCGEVSLHMMGYYFCSETLVTIFDLCTCVHLEYSQGAGIRSCTRGQSITKPAHIQTPIKKQLHIIYQTKELTDRIDRQICKRKQTKIIVKPPGLLKIFGQFLSLNCKARKTRDRVYSTYHYWEWPSISHTQGVEIPRIK